MAVPSSGPLELRGDINLEVNGNVTDTNVALHQLSIDAGFSTPDAMSDFYGYSSVVPPTVTTQAACSITPSSMTLNGNVTDTGGENVTRGFYFGTSANPASSNTKYALGGTSGTGPYVCGKSGLTQGTTYYNWAFACNSAGEALGARDTAATTYPPFTPSGFDTGVFFANNNEWICAGTPVNPQPGCRCAYAYMRGRAGWVNPYSGGLNETMYICNDNLQVNGQTAQCYSPGLSQCYCAFASANSGVKNWHCVCNCLQMYSATNGPGTCVQMENCHWMCVHTNRCRNTVTCSCSSCIVCFQSVTPSCFKAYYACPASSNSPSTSKWGANLVQTQTYPSGRGYAFNHLFSTYYLTSDIRLKTNINYL